MKIDRQKWNAARAKTETQIRELKATMRASGHMVSYSEQCGLSLLKEEATRLYQVRAQYRGKQHRFFEVEYIHELGRNHGPGNVKVRGPISKEAERDSVEFLMEQYALEELPEPPVAGHVTVHVSGVVPASLEEAGWAEEIERVIET